MQILPEHKTSEPVHACLQMAGPTQVASRSNMDMNGHINNVTYLAWTLETVPMEVFQTYTLKQVGLSSAAHACVMTLTTVLTSRNGRLVLAGMRRLKCSCVPWLLLQSLLLVTAGATRLPGRVP
jgi:Acyl-ACP thioesterase